LGGGVGRQSAEAQRKNGEALHGIPPFVVTGIEIRRACRHVFAAAADELPDRPHRTANGAL
jgi:hypothetical protein